MTTTRAYITDAALFEQCITHLLDAGRATLAGDPAAHDARMREFEATAEQAVHVPPGTAEAESDARYRLVTRFLLELTANLETTATPTTTPSET